MNVDEFPPTRDIFDKIPRNFSECYDMETQKLTIIQKDRIVKYIIVKSPYDYQISNSNDSDENTLALFILALPHKLYNNYKNFNSYVSKLIDKFFLESDFKDVDIDIKVTSKHVNIVFTLDGILYSKIYKSKSDSLSEVLLYEYFKHISEFDYQTLFEYSDRHGFRVKYSELSILEFFERCFKDVYGNFRAINGTVISDCLAIFNKLNVVSSNVSENMKVFNDEFLVFFSEYVIPDLEFQTEVVLSRIIN